MSLYVQRIQNQTQYSITPVSKMGHDVSSPTQFSIKPECFRVLSRLLLSIYIVVTIPLRLAFIPEFKVDIFSYGVFIGTDLLCFFFFIYDTLQSVHHATKVQQVTPSSDRSDSVTDRNYSELSDSQEQPYLRRHVYRKHSQFLIISILSCVPFEYVTLIPFYKFPAVNYFMMNRMIRCYYLPSYIEDFSRLLEYKGVFRNKGLQRAWQLFFIMALAGHLCCCGFFVFGKMATIYGEHLTWVEELDLIESHGYGDFKMLVSVQEAYIQSLYWAYITMITTGFGDIVPLSVPETVWCIFTMFLGVMITACAIANLQLVVTNVDAALTNFQRKIATVSKYMRYRKLPNNLQNRIMSFYHYQWDVLRGADEAMFLRELPKSLQQQISNFMCRDLIAVLPVLRKANTALLNALADCSEVNIYSPDDDILKVGEPIRGTLLISRGEVEVLTDGRVERKMKRCDTFAEDCLFVKKISDKNVKAKTFCELLTIPSDVFLHIIKAQCDLEQINQMREIAVTISKNSKKANKLFGSGEDVVPIRRRHFHPSSSFRAVWDFCALLCYVYYIFSIPLMVMKFLDGQKFQENITTFIMSYLVDIFFIVDLYLRFNFFMYFEEGLVIFNKERIRRRFKKQRSLVKELFVAVPIDALILLVNTRFSFLLRLTKLLRLPQILKIVDDFKRHLSDFQLSGEGIFFKVIILNSVLLIVCHWVGTMWHGCADLSTIIGFPVNWRISDENDETLSISHADFGGWNGYLRSVYWAIVGMSTTGYGDIIPTNLVETTFAAIIILFGGLILPAVVGGLAAYLGNLNMTRREYRMKLVAAKSYMKHYIVDKASVNRVTSYYDYLWSRQDAIDEESIMKEFPWPLRQQVGIHLHNSRINTVPFFADCEDSIRDLIVSILKPRIFMPMDIVIKKGEIGTSMYFIEKGEVAILAQDGMAFCVLEAGDYFGESSLISAASLTSSAKALTYCDVFVLQKEDFQSIMDEFVSLEKQEKISKNMIKTMKKKIKVNKNVKHNLEEHPKCSTLVSMIDLVKKGGMVVDKKGNKVNVYPASKLYLMWSFGIIIICMYNACMIPFRLAFVRNPILMLDTFSDCYLVVDMYLNYCRFALLREGEIIDDTETVKRYYMKKRFKIDILSSLPYELIYFAIKSDRSSAIVMAIIRGLKLLRLVRLPKMLSTIFNFLEDNNFNLAPFRLLEFLSGVMLIAHWAACGFYGFAHWKNDEIDCIGLDTSELVVNWANEVTECRWKNTWIQRQIINGKIPHTGGTVFQLYIRSFNWALPTLVVVVIGDVVPVSSSESLYAFIWMVLGVTINAAIIGNVANIVANVDTESSIFNKQADGVKKYMHELKISGLLQNRVNHYLNCLWEHKESLNEDSFVDSLPSTLQIQVTQKTRQKHIAICPFFDFCSNEIVKALSFRLKLQMFSNHDVIVYAGDMGREMFFLDIGTVDILSPDGKTVFATLSANADRKEKSSLAGESAFFGETSLFFKQRRTNTVRASSYCEVYVLHKDDLDRELRQRDFDLSRMLQVFTRIAQSNKRRNQAVEANLDSARSLDSKLSKMIDPNMTFSIRVKKIHPFLIPSSSFRIIWDFLCLIFTIYIVVATTFRAAFAYQKISNFSLWIICDFFIDLFFLVDCYLRSFVFPVNHNGSLVTDKEEIRLDYEKNGMYYDIIACIPFELFVFWCGKDYFFQLRLVHTVRIVRLPMYFTKAESYLNFYNIRVNAAKRLLLSMFFYYAVINHCCACIWFAIHRFLESHTKYTWATTDCPNGDEFASDGCLSVWIEEQNRHNLCDKNMIARCYVRSLYFVLTTTSTVGYGDISPVTDLETIYQCVVVLIGACFLAGFIGSFAEFFSQNDESGQSAYETKLKKLQDYMKYRNLPQSLQEEILFFHHHKWNHSHILDEREVLSILPIPLQMELCFETLQPIIIQFPVLTEIEVRVQKRISHSLSRYVCPPHATIYKAGDIGWDIYFISSGLIQLKLPSNLDVLDEEGRANHDRVKEKATSVGLIYRAGNHFGESCLKSQSGVRQETVVTKTAATLFHISKERLQHIFDTMGPKEKSKIMNNLLSRNGNVWHSFEDINELLEEGHENSSRSYSHASKKTDGLSLFDSKNRISTLSKRRPTHRRKSARLRSFSAAASTQAIKKLTTNNLESLYDRSTYQASCVEAALKVSKRSAITAFNEDNDSETTINNNYFDITEEDLRSSSTSLQ